MQRLIAQAQANLDQTIDALKHAVIDDVSPAEMVALKRAKKLLNEEILVLHLM